MFTYHTEHAAKIGNHELRNANLIFSGSRALLDKEGGDSSSGVGPVRVPLMVMVDFLGSRSLATSKLPISPETLVFGSDDAGENIRRDDILLPGMENKTPYELMRSISIELNLKAHLVVDQTTRRLVQIDSCADLEGSYFRPLSTTYSHAIHVSSQVTWVLTHVSMCLTLRA